MCTVSNSAMFARHDSASRTPDDDEDDDDAVLVLEAMHGDGVIDGVKSTS